MDTISHTKEIIIIDPSSTPRTIPKSFSMSRIAKNYGCNSRNIDSPIAIGAIMIAEILTPKSVFRI
jgi:hypothetical protein